MREDTRATRRPSSRSDAARLVLFVASVLVAGCAGAVSEAPASDVETGTIQATAAASVYLDPTTDPFEEPVSSTGGEVPTPELPDIPQPSVAPLPEWLVGSWVQENSTDSLTGGKTRRIYLLRPDGVYEYWHLLCPTYDQCDGPYEWGFVAASASTLTILPQTESVEGPRTYEYAVVQDQIGAWTLRFALPDYVDVFYLQR